MVFTLTCVKNLALAVAGMAALAAPIMVVVMPTIRAQSRQSLAQSAPAATPIFEVASVKPCQGRDRRTGSIPAAILSGRYSIAANAEGVASGDMMNGPMLQALLEDRFKLKIHRQTKEARYYAENHWAPD
jgi:hypothetical protein